MLLSIIVPAYNEEKTLEKTIKEFCDYLNRQNYDYEIIIVNDGSRDRTLELAQKIKTQFKNIVVINNPINQGKGAAIRQGLLTARGQYRIFIDADNATSIDHLEKVWPHFENGCEIVIGSRNKKDALGACQAVPQAIWKRLLGMAGNAIIQLLAVPGIWDTQCGFKAFTEKSVTSIIPQTKINRWALDIEILTLARLLNYKIAKIPVHWINSPNSRVGIKGYFLTLKETFQIKYNLLAGKYQSIE